MRVLGEHRDKELTHHADVLNGQLANKVLPVGIVLGSEAQLCDGGAGSGGRASGRSSMSDREWKRE
jgi:hypothetical protein